MRTAAAISATIHIAVFVVAWLGVLPSSRPFVAPAQVIDVEIATELKKEPPKPVAKSEPKQISPPPRQEPPPEPQVASKPEPEAVPAPKPKPKIVPKPKPKVAKPLKPKPKKTVKRPRPRPKSKPKPPSKAKTFPKHDFASVLKTVKKLDKIPPKPQKKKNPKVSPMQQVAAALKRTQQQPRLFRQPGGITAGELDAVRRHIEPCWNLPAGARDAQSMVVEIRATLNPDGRVRSAVIVDKARSRSDGFYRSMAESALRAMLNPRCQPLPLPLNKYSEWRDMVIFFDPQEMF